METIRDELQFNNHKISEYEQMLASEKSRVKEMEQELQVRQKSTSKIKLMSV